MWLCCVIFSYDAKHSLPFNFFFLSIFTKDFSLEYTKDFCQCVWFLYQGNTGLVDTQWSESHSVVSDSLRPRGLYSPCNSPDQSTGMGSLSLLQGIFPTQGLNPGLPHHRQILYQLRDGKTSAYNAGDPGSISLAWKIPWMEEPGGLQSMSHKESDTSEWPRFTNTGLIELAGKLFLCLCFWNIFSLWRIGTIF